MPPSAAKFLLDRVPALGRLNVAVDRVRAHPLQHLDRLGGVLRRPLPGALLGDCPAGALGGHCAAATSRRRAAIP